MAKKKDGITDLTKTLVSAAQKFNDTEYNRLQHLIFALLHGVNFGYTSMDQRFLDDSSDIYFLHKDQQDNPKKVFKKNKTKYNNNVIQLKDFSREALNGDG
jgi:predicted secreted protein